MVANSWVKADMDQGDTFGRVPHSAGAYIMALPTKVGIKRVGIVRFWPRADDSKSRLYASIGRVIENQVSAIDWGNGTRRVCD